jgi:hypothetical protein
MGISMVKVNWGNGELSPLVGSFGNESRPMRTRRKTNICRSEFEIREPHPHTDGYTVGRERDGLSPKAASLKLIR